MFRSFGIPAALVTICCWIWNFGFREGVECLGFWVFFGYGFVQNQVTLLQCQDWGGGICGFQSGDGSEGRGGS